MLDSSWWPCGDPTPDTPSLLPIFHRGVISGFLLVLYVDWDRWDWYNNSPPHSVMAYVKENPPYCMLSCSVGIAFHPSHRMSYTGFQGWISNRGEWCFAIPVRTVLSRWHGWVWLRYMLLYDLPYDSELLIFPQFGIYPVQACGAWVLLMFLGWGFPFHHEYGMVG